MPRRPCNGGRRRAREPGRKRDDRSAERGREGEARAQATASACGRLDGGWALRGRRRSGAEIRDDDPDGAEPLDRQGAPVGEIDGGQRPVRQRELGRARGPEASAERHGRGRARRRLHSSTVGAQPVP
jgi:hypothetical protein